MDTKHYKYTIEQLNASVKNGSLYKKSNKIVVRKVAPEIKKSNVPSMVDAIIPSREKSIFKINQEKYEELSISDEEFAKENADLAELDSQPVKKV
jgi:hypothetical protein